MNDNDIKYILKHNPCVQYTEQDSYYKYFMCTIDKCKSDYNHKFYSLVAKNRYVKNYRCRSVIHIFEEKYPDRIEQLTKCNLVLVKVGYSSVIAKCNSCNADIRISKWYFNHRFDKIGDRHTCPVAKIPKSPKPELDDLIMMMENLKL